MKYESEPTTEIVEAEQFDGTPHSARKIAIFTNRTTEMRFNPGGENNIDLFAYPPDRPDITLVLHPGDYIVSSEEFKIMHKTEFESKFHPIE